MGSFRDSTIAAAVSMSWKIVSLSSRDTKYKLKKYRVFTKELQAYRRQRRSTESALPVS
jgi:hypothetical protein